MFKKGDSFTIKNNFGHNMLVKIESDPRYMKGFSDPSYKVSFDGKIIKSLFPQGCLVNYKENELKG